MKIKKEKGRRIVIEPIFNEYPFLKQQIENICEVIKPDYIFLVDGMFPNGPENSLNKTQTDNFIKKYTLNGQGKRSFDLDKVKKIIDKLKKRYLKTFFR